MKLRPVNFQAAATAARHVFIAAARKLRCVRAALSRASGLQFPLQPGTQGNAENRLRRIPVPA
jgi:hypothetical protein